MPTAKIPHGTMRDVGYYGWMQCAVQNDMERHRVTPLMRAVHTNKTHRSRRRHEAYHRERCGSCLARQRRSYSEGRIAPKCQFSLIPGPFSHMGRMCATGFSAFQRHGAIVGLPSPARGRGAGGEGKQRRTMRNSNMSTNNLSVPKPALGEGF
jgi:hypothetical protein